MPYICGWPAGSDNKEVSLVAWSGDCKEAVGGHLIYVGILWSMMTTVTKKN